LKSLQCSMKGKIQLCNTVIFPILLYRTATILPTKAFFKKYKKVIFSFLYGEGRREVFSRKIVELDVAHAGAGLQNIENRCNGSFILRFSPLFSIGTGWVRLHVGVTPLERVVPPALSRGTALSRGGYSEASSC